MLNFNYYNPVRIIFGRDTIEQLPSLIPPAAHVMLTYGGGSIKRNGIYDAVTSALQSYALTEFGGIEPNPKYETLTRAVAHARKNNVDFLLAVGGGSVIDGTKFIAAACATACDDPWKILTQELDITDALPFGTILTIPAAGSEMNPHAVISRITPPQKLAFSNEKVFPQFSILDPSTTFSLPPRLIRNSVVDPFVHVIEQYLTYPVNAPLQDACAEALLRIIIEKGPETLTHPNDYDTRATMMWCATHALNGSIGCGVPQDWATHAIGHELTALYGIDHAHSLSIVLPALLTHRSAQKEAKLLQFAQNVWHINDGSTREKIEKAISSTVHFFRTCNMPVCFADCDIPDDAPDIVAKRLTERNATLGENADITPDIVHEILTLCKSHPLD